MPATITPETDSITVLLPTRSVRELPAGNYWVFPLIKNAVHGKDRKEGDSKLHNPHDTNKRETTEFYGTLLVGPGLDYMNGLDKARSWIDRQAERDRFEAPAKQLNVMLRLAGKRELKPSTKVYLFLSEDDNSGWEAVLRDNVPNKDSKNRWKPLEHILN